jgi:hypothetical protein
VIIDWVAPNDNGSPITSYRIRIKQKDTVFEEELTNCDGLESDLVTNTQCIIPILTLEASPFLLDLGDSIIATVTATNKYGESAESV